MSSTERPESNGPVGTADVGGSAASIELGSQVICQIGDQAEWWAAACRRTIDAANRIIEEGNDHLRWLDHANAARTVYQFMWPAKKR